jgi:hypothetical protein
LLHRNARRLEDQKAINREGAKNAKVKKKTRKPSTMEVTKYTEEPEALDRPRIVRMCPWLQRG